ncbi:signal peptidase II [Nakamurella multipartita]|jgi:signal peptidase II|uniref:Lipoprotein signal peptidase n=1 Tax=Nakamurella multipartita (strain ATCC 700099 / DSM 44233 / CIP 104796 / JCM 9543 / NBRC 105858 / Y-104) TaxID=479431 RepID=C8XCS5_NAKMY|nr:lipoprotein signal peptidase [Nakamurella multipartita DSM 44233]
MVGVTDQPEDAPPATDQTPADPTPAQSTPADPASTDSTPLKPRKVGLLAAIAATVIVLDVISKVIVVATIQPNQPVRVLGGLVYLSLIRNPGAAFSMATGMTWLLALIAIGVVVVIIRMAPRLRSTPWAISLGLVLGGAIGNLIDRIFRAPGFLQGHVVDFVSVFGPNAEYFPVFNVADSAITIGGISLVITALLGIDFDGTRTRSRKDDSA